jgi:hypothetical protein
MYSNSASAHNKSLQTAMPLDDKGFDFRKEEKLFSSAQALKFMQLRFIPSGKGAQKSSGPHACT